MHDNGIDTKIKICWWTHFPTPNQSAIVKSLRRAGIDAVICYFKENYDDYRRSLGWKKMPLEEFEYQFSSVAEASKRIGDFSSRIQVVPSYYDLISWKLMAWCIFNGKPFVASIENSRGRIRSFLVRKTFAKICNAFALKVFCVGKKAVNEFSALGIRDSKLAWTAYAIDDSFFVPPKESPRKEIVFAYTGALIKPKGVEVLHSAFMKLHAQFKNARLLVVGDGDCRSLFEGNAAIRLYAPVAPDKIKDILIDADVIVLPSRRDAWGVSLVEGAALGKPMISTKETGASELITSNPPNGVCIETLDEDSLYNAMAIYVKDKIRVLSDGIQAYKAAQAVRSSLLADRMKSDLLSGMGASAS
jgi:glycosyltransferase involved in cell wall biosynthesis